MLNSNKEQRLFNKIKKRLQPDSKKQVVNGIINNYNEWQREVLDNED